MRRFSAEEKNDQEFRKVLQKISTEPDTIRHSCTKCRVGKPSMECSDCFALLCQGCVRFYGHDPTHKITFHHPENLPQNIIPGQPANRLPPDLELAGVIPGGRKERLWKKGLGEQLKSLSESDSDCESAGDIREALSKNYKALRTDAVARALFERTVRVCHDCNFEIFDVGNGHAHDFHTNVTEPEQAGEAIKAIFSKYKLSGPTFAKRGEEAQHLCIVEKDKLLRTSHASIANIGNAYTECTRVLEEFKSEFTKSLKVALAERSSELDVIDATLFSQLKMENFYDNMLARIREIGESNPAAAVNLWRQYCAEIRKSEWRRRGGSARFDNKTSGKPAPGGMYFSQTAEFIENVNHALNNVKVRYDSLIGAIGRVIGDHIERTIMLPEKARARLEDDYVAADDIASLREAHRLQCLTGLPLDVTKGGAGASEPIPYAKNLGEINKASFFYMVDTFHTKWTKVMAAIHETRWLAIYVPERPSVIDGDDPTRGFRSGEFSSIVEESEQPLYRSPPECIINLGEIQVNQIAAAGAGEISGAQVISPIGKLLSAVLNIPALEVIRIVNRRPVGWWTFVHPDAGLLDDWAVALSTWGAAPVGREVSWPSRSSTYVPSTNPGTSAKSLGVHLPPIGRRWAAVHVREAPRNYEGAPLKPAAGSKKEVSTTSGE